MAARNRVRNWNVLCWNIRGLNAESKWKSLKNKVSKRQCDVVCLPETKKEDFNILFFKLLYPHLLTVTALSPLLVLLGAF